MTYWRNRKKRSASKKALTKDSLAGYVIEIQKQAVKSFNGVIQKDSKLDELFSVSLGYMDTIFEQDYWTYFNIFCIIYGYWTALKHLLTFQKGMERQFEVIVLKLESIKDHTFKICSDVVIGNGDARSYSSALAPLKFTTQQELECLLVYIVATEPADQLLMKWIKYGFCHVKMYDDDAEQIDDCNEYNAEQNDAEQNVIIKCMMMMLNKMMMMPKHGIKLAMSTIIHTITMDTITMITMTTKSVGK